MLDRTIGKIKQLFKRHKTDSDSIVNSIHTTDNGGTIIKKQFVNENGETVIRIISYKDTVETHIDEVVSYKKKEWTLPPFSLLDNIDNNKTDQQAIYKYGRQIMGLFDAYGINVELVDIVTGPIFTHFEIRPELGTSIKKIVSLKTELQMLLAAPDLQIIAPIPGKAAIGIDIPTKTPSVVTLREVLEAAEKTYSKEQVLTFPAGKDMYGNVVNINLDKMPHLLVAGTTGSGKSVFLHSIIMSILYRYTPNEVGLILIDTQRVEFNIYNGIPNLVKPIIYNADQAVSSLRWVVSEMNDRYDRLSNAGVKNYRDYNLFAKDQTGMKPIVIIIDEFAELMFISPKEVENIICNLARLSRAVGIHLIISTQKPSSNVITGLIKTNIVSRVAFKVVNGFDSRLIINDSGAEALLGNGDMLISKPDKSGLLRVKGAYVSDSEIKRTVNYLIRQ